MVLKLTTLPVLSNLSSVGGDIGGGSSGGRPTRNGEMLVYCNTRLDGVGYMNT